MIQLGTNGIRTILCLGAHADDIEIGCGGTLLRLLQDNQDMVVHWIVLSGSEERRSEAEESAGRFLTGVASKAIRIMDFPDSFFLQRSSFISFIHCLI